MACYFLRDRDGFCHLTNRCWSGKPCPANERQAERARLQLIDEFIARRESKGTSRLLPPSMTPKQGATP